jgi:hypothetical protein
VSPVSALSKSIRISSRSMSGHVFRPMSREGIFRRVMSSRDVAIRGAASQIGFDIMTLGMLADGAGRRHVIFTVLGGRADSPWPPSRSPPAPRLRTRKLIFLACVQIRRSSPRAVAAASAAQGENNAIPFAQGALRPPSLARDRPEFWLPSSGEASGRAASARLASG